MLLFGKIIAAALCIAALIVTFRTEYVLKSFFRVNNADSRLILRTKLITLCVTAALFAAVMILFR